MKKAGRSVRSARRCGYNRRFPQYPAGGRLDMRILIIILTLIAASGCTSMLLGADVAPAEQRDTDEDERPKRDK